MVWDSGKRTAASFGALPAEALFRSVNARLYGLDEGGGARITFHDDAQVAAFNITLACNALAGWKVFLFDLDDRSRLLWHHDATAEAGELTVPHGVCDAVIDATYRLILAKADGPTA